MKRIEVRFHDSADGALLKFAVIIARSEGKWVLCRHKDRSTLEVPGGHREIGESIDETAARELYEETGAVSYTLSPVCVYSVDDGETHTYGMLYSAEITEFEEELHSEIAQIILSADLPEAWTYPQIQPKLLAEAARRGFIK